MPVDPLAAISTLHGVGGAIRSKRTARRANASNVILVVTYEPRRLHGFKVVLEVMNRSAVGICDVAVALTMLGGGELDMSGTVRASDTTFARRPVPAGDSLTFALPAIVRPAEATLDLESDAVMAHTAKLFWRDESGKAWARVDAGPARKCKGREYPARG